MKLYEILEKNINLLCDHLQPNDTRKDVAHAYNLVMIAYVRDHKIEDLKKVIETVGHHVHNKFLTVAENSSEDKWVRHSAIDSFANVFRLLSRHLYNVSQANTSSKGIKSAFDQQYIEDVTKTLGQKIQQAIERLIIIAEDETELTDIRAKAITTVESLFTDAKHALNEIDSEPYSERFTKIAETTTNNQVAEYAIGSGMK